MADFLKIICLDETLRAKYSTHNVMRRTRERAFLVSTLTSSSLSAISGVKLGESY